MSATFAAFHSTECNDPTFLAEGWYLGPMDKDGIIADDWTHDFRGPYLTESDALDALRRGEHIKGQS